VLEREDGGEIVRAVVRQRIGRRAGDAVLLDVPSECWVLSRSGSASLAPAVWRLDRARLRQGGEPWRVVGPSELIYVRDPAGTGSWLRGTVPSLCGSCHSGDRGDASERARATREEQLERAQRAMVR
jgi:hypothetical protein